MKVCVCTMYSPSHQELADLTVPNMKEYAQKHGYDTYEIKVENDQWEFKKHGAFTELFNIGYDLVWYKDVDTMITNMTIPVTDFIDDEHSFFITKDWTELNGGSVIIKNDDFGKKYNAFILESKYRYQNEQNAYNDTYENLKHGIKIIPQHTINAYLYELYPEIGKLTKEEGQWEEGCLLLHTPALQMDKRIEILKNAKIVYE